MTEPNADDELVPLLAISPLTITMPMQTIQHDPDAGLSGDCYRVCLAALLGLNDPLLVPHFAELAADTLDRPGWEMTRLTRLWLREHHDCDLVTTPRADAAGFGIPYMATVHSQRGPWKHGVIALGHEIIHDPSGVGGYTFGQHGIAHDDPSAPDGDVAEMLSVKYQPGPDELVARWRAAALEVAPDPA